MNTSMRPIEVGILGGTGMVGQHFIRFLEGQAIRSRNEET